MFSRRKRETGQPIKFRDVTSDPRFAQVEGTWAAIGDPEFGSVHGAVIDAVHDALDTDSTRGRNHHA